MSNSASAAFPIVTPKKLIEVAIPLDEINKASAREKSIRHGHPSTLHLWWARRPLAAARAVLFAQLVNDPAWKYSEEELKKPQIKGAITKKRNELFKLITQLVQWENTNNEEVLQKARAAIRESWRETCEANKNHADSKTLFKPDKLPPFHDPFAGGGSIPLEAQRLGLSAHATDLNPVAVLINKAMIELPPQFAGRPPVGPIPRGEKQTKATATEDWSGAKGLAEDVRRYGAWMREEAWNRVGHLYPKVTISKEMVKERPDLQEYLGKELTVVAWIWARTVPSPNPALNGLRVPLASSFWLSQKAGVESWIDASVTKNKCVYRVRRETPRNPDKVAEGTKTSRGANFRCLASGVSITPEYIKKVGTDSGLEVDLMAVVAEGKKGRVYLSPTEEMKAIASKEKPSWRPTQSLPNDPRNFWTLNYGLSKFSDLFTERQLIVLSTLSDLVVEARQKIIQDVLKVRNAFTEEYAQSYSAAIALYLALAVNLLLDDLVTLATWRSTHGTGAMGHAFARQTVPMTWDFPEANPFASAAGDIENSIHSVAMCLDALPASAPGKASMMDATSSWNEGLTSQIISTDPPYYDNISYADLSDFFYVWLRRSVKETYASITATILTPKTEELIASPYRHGGSDAADKFFLAGMKSALHQARHRMHGAIPITIYYAFKQSETDDGGTASTGWEVFLEAVQAAGFIVTATWPLRTERGARAIGRGTNALASSIVLVIRPRDPSAATVARKDFLRELDHALPTALEDMTSDAIAAIAPVDLAQAAIGPGMAIFSKYEAVLEADGTAMSVHNALIHINKAIDDYFAQAEGDMDADTRFCIGWFQQYEFEEGPFGEADVLARAKGTAVDGVREAGVIHAAKGKVRLLRVKEYPASWNPKKDSRLPIWEACHQMCRALGESETEAGALLARMPEKQDDIRQLAYRLYTICERKGWAEDARAYNELIMSWPAIVEESLKAGHKGSQMSLL